MTTKRQLLTIALSQFAQHGYEGTSLADIASEAGIKKPSIYAHFKSKEDLFLNVLRQTFREFKRRIIRYMIHHVDIPLQDRLYQLIAFLQQQYSDDAMIKFVMRMCFFPHSASEKEIIPLVYALIDDLEARLLRLLDVHVDQHHLQLVVSTTEAAKGYMTVVDGVMIDMLYSEPSRSVQRLNVIFPIYWRGITLTATTT
ncbi:TetR/AcrR family transcriptional regulator [Paenibacillus sp. KACC 21273]|uniref:TetR/AcrR family transcriptional regulator n=1 Tax=Paenibacillus sp. KACC 21273 TaxID=3025665 RepID=UPI002365A63A|nr:TetR/AcrR family transcriptional regulator [Paenibacillus sp. KACC 21273]WDF51410.1 TetR/AcrR family transcriptional regulator [Paenibacillus sp. KACC 21273]